MPGKTFAAAVGIALVLAATEPSRGTTELPLTYIRDYSAGHAEDESFLRRIAANAPELLVLGKDGPLHHNWGFVAGSGGENQSFGQGEHIRRLSPVEVRDKIARIRAMNAKLHASGVRWIMPYICTMTIGGDPERRTGLWEFFDHWADYAEFGLGPKPREDPIDWLQRRADGSLLFYYPPENPNYAPNRRWAACIHQPGWRRHLANVVRLAGEAGFDGVYMDNNRSTRCHCERCQEAFRGYVSARLSSDEIRRDLGCEHMRDLRLNPDADPFVLESMVTADKPAAAPKLKLGLNLYHVKLTWEFWTDSKVEFLRELKAIGTKARGGEFHIFANTTAYTKGAHEPGRVAAVASFNQSEENGAEAGAHPGLVPAEIGGPLGVTHNRRAFEYKFYQSFEHGMRVGMLTRPGHGLPSATRLAIDQNPQTAELSLAESAAFGGGGGYKMDLRWDQDGTVQRWRRFFAEHRALYENTAVWAPLGVIAFTEQFFCGLDKTHQEEVREISSRLLEHGALFDLIHERTFSLERLQRFRAVVVPRGVRSLPATQIEVFRRYAAQGGTLVFADDDFAAMDERCRPRPVRERSVDGAKRLSSIVSSGIAFAAISDVIGSDVGIMRSSAGRVPSGVGVNAFRTASGDVVLHLVNYNVPLGEGRTDPPIVLRDLVVTIPLPPAWQDASARAFSAYPTEELAVSCEVREAKVGLRIPSLTLYKLIRISRGDGAK